MCALQSKHVTNQASSCYSGLAASPTAKFACSPLLNGRFGRAWTYGYRACHHTFFRRSICSALDGRAAAKAFSPSGSFIPAIALAPGALGLVSIAIRGASEASCFQANVVAVLTAALLFLLYFCTSLTEDRHPWVSRLARALRPSQDQLLYGCGLAAAAQLATAAGLCIAHPVHGEGAFVPLYGAGYASLAVLVASQRGRRLKGRKILEIEAGEGERHAVMAQGARLAARNYTWLILLMHLALQAVATAAAGATAGTVAAAAAVGGPMLLPPVAAVAYGVLTILYSTAGACKFLTAS